MPGTNPTTRRRTFNQLVHAFAKPIIEAALDESGGNLNHAARILGMTEQNLRWMLANRFPELTGDRNQRRDLPAIEHDLVTELVM